MTTDQRKEAAATLQAIAQSLKTGKDELSEGQKLAGIRAVGILIGCFLNDVNRIANNMDRIGDAMERSGRNISVDGDNPEVEDDEIAF